jgi:hypothetical protein
VGALPRWNLQLAVSSPASNLLLRGKLLTAGERAALERLIRIAQHDLDGFACERWIYSHQIEYSRNLIFEVGGSMEKVFQTLIDRSRTLLDLKKHQDHPG